MKSIVAALTIGIVHAAAAQAQQGGSSLAPIVRTESVGAGVIRIVYDLNRTAGSVFTIALEVSSDGGRTFAIRPRATTGDVGSTVAPGLGKTIEWDSTKDVEDLQLDRYVFRVVVTPVGSGSAAAPSSPASPPVGSGGRGGAPADRSSGGTTAGVKKSGGLSKGAIAALTGGVAAGGIGLAVAKGKGSSSTPTPPTTPPSTTLRVFRGTASGPITFEYPICAGRASGTQTENWTFTLTISLNVASTGTVTGTAAGSVETVLISGCPGTIVGTTGTAGFAVGQVTGTTSSLMFGGTNTVPTRTNQWSFAGSVAADVLSGTLEYTTTFAPNTGSGGGRGAARFAVSIREQ